MKKKLLLQMSIALIMFIPMMLVGQITDQKVNESANIETYAICLDNGLSYAQFSDQANSQQIEFKSRKGWFKSILGVVCTVVAVVDAVFGDGDLVEPLANAQCALLGSALVVDSRGGAIGSGDFPPSYMQGPAPTLESGSETYSAFNAINAYHVSLENDSLIALENATNGLMDAFDSLKYYSSEPDVIFLPYLEAVSSSIMNYANVLESLGFNIYIKQTDIQYFQDSCSTGYLPAIEDAAFVNAGLSFEQRHLLAIYFADMPFTLSVDSVSLCDALLEAAETNLYTSPVVEDEQIIRYDNGTNFNAVGSLGGVIYAAAYFPASDIEQYAGMALENVEIYIGQNPISITLMIYGPGSTTSPGDTIYTQPVEVTANSWNMIALASPVPITGEDLWIGYKAVHDSGTYPSGIDAGPAIAGFGDKTSEDGIIWVSLAAVDLDYNWNIAGYLGDGGVLCPTANAGADATIEADESFLLSDATATNFSSLLWTSSGDGMFDDATILNSTYLPGAADIAASTVELCLTANPNDPCTGSVTDCMTLAIIPEGLQVQVIEIPGNWSLISSYLVPINPSMEYLFADMVSQNKLEVMLGKNGILWPSGSINTIGDWDVYQGYKVKMNEAGSIEVIGEIPDNKTISLNAGANYMPVLSVEYYSAGDIFAQLGSGLIFAYDLGSESLYWPAGGIYTLDVLEPGKGYLVGMTQPGQATYDPLLKMDFKGYVPVKPKVYENSPWKVTKSGSPHLISIDRSALAGFDPGDFIGVFNAEGMCVGMSKIDKTENNLLLVAYGNDFTMKTATGLADGEAMQFRVYRTSTMAETHAAVSFDASMPNMGLFTENGLSKIMKIKTGATSVGEALLSDIQIYPNPSDGTFTISGLDSKANIKIVNILGDQVYSGEVDLPSKLDLSAQPKGVYFISIETGRSKFFKKLLIN